MYPISTFQMFKGFTELKYSCGTLKQAFPINLSTAKLTKFN